MFYKLQYHFVFGVIIYFFILAMGSFVVQAQTNPSGLDPDFVAALENQEISLAFIRTTPPDAEEPLECRVDSNNQYVSVPGEGVYRIRDGQLLAGIPQPVNNYRFSPQGNYAYETDGIYRLNDAQLLDFVPDSGLYQFSPADRYVGVSFSADGIYDLELGQRLEPITGAIGTIFPYTFSEDSYVAIQDVGVFRLDGLDSERISSIPENVPADRGIQAYAFSPTSEYVAVLGLGLYQLDDGRLVEEIQFPVDPNDNYVFSSFGFSPDGQYFAVRGGGVFRLSDRTHIESIPFDAHYLYAFAGDMIGIRPISSGDVFGFFSLPDGQLIESISFNGFIKSPDQSYIAVRSTGVFDTSTTEQIDYLPVADSYSFSPDGQLLATSQMGIYRFEDGSLIEGIPEVESASEYIFSPDSSMVGIAGDGIYSTEDGHLLLGDMPDGSLEIGVSALIIGCHIFAVTDSGYANIGMVTIPGGVNVRGAPVIEDNIATVTSSTTAVTLHGANEAGDWYFVTYEGQQVWVATSVLQGNPSFTDLPLIDG